MKLLAGNSNQALAQAVSDHLDIPLTKAQVKRFADNEVWVTIDENVRGEDVFVIQSTSYPTNDNLMELLICIDALKRASARRITPPTSAAGSQPAKQAWRPSSSLSTAALAPIHTPTGGLKPFFLAKAG